MRYILTFVNWLGLWFLVGLGIGLYTGTHAWQALPFMGALQGCCGAVLFCFGLWVLSETHSHNVFFYTLICYGLLGIIASIFALVFLALFLPIALTIVTFSIAILGGLICGLTNKILLNHLHFKISFMPLQNSFPVDEFNSDLKKEFHFLIDPMGFSLIEDTERLFSFLFCYQKDNLRFHFNYDWRDNFFYFTVLRGKDTPLPGDFGSKNALPLFRLLEQCEPKLHVKKLQPERNREYKATLAYTAELVKKHMDFFITWARKQE